VLTGGGYYVRLELFVGGFNAMTAAAKAMYIIAQRGAWWRLSSRPVGRVAVRCGVRPGCD
jgi:hypothetical protein